MMPARPARGWCAPDHHLRAFAARAAASLPPGARVLDAGAGDSPYRPLFAHACYEAADVCKRDSHAYAHVGYVCDLAAIPVEDGRFDAILCTQVLEHVPAPDAVLGEFHRTLKPGGRLWASAPLCFEEHEVPYDFFRYTQYGWRALLERNGFDVVSIEPVQGFLGTLAYQANYARHNLPVHPRHYGGGAAGLAGAALALAARPLLAATAFAWAAFDRHHRCTDVGHPLDYAIVAERRT